jgi:hypothetical protein
MATTNIMATTNTNIMATTNTNANIMATTNTNANIMATTNNTIRLVTRKGPVIFDITSVNISTTTIAMLKVMIADIVNISPENQCILRTYPGGISNINFKEMLSNQTMGECSITVGVHLFVWSSTDPVVMKVRAHEARQEKYSREAAKLWEKENAKLVKKREEREDVTKRTREEERLTQLFLEGYEIELRKEKEAELYWASWRKRHNL